MPVTTLGLSKVKRTPSVHSEQSSSLSDSPRHVSFNQDVSIKRIPKKILLRPARSVPLTPGDEFAGKCDIFVNIPPPSDKDQIAVEAEQILRQLQDIECSVSPTPRGDAAATPTRSLLSSPSPLTVGGRPNTAEGRRLGQLGLGLAAGKRLSKSSSDLVRGGRSEPAGRLPTRASSAMRVEGHSEQEEEGPQLQPVSQASSFYGLQALSNLDQAVNGGNKLNNLYRDRSGSTDYSPPLKKNNNNTFTPPKPPRKAPSSSPPMLRKGYASLDELEFVQSRGKREGSAAANTDAMYRGIGGHRYDLVETQEEEEPHSYTGTNPQLTHLRQSSPSRYLPAGGIRMSPSRGNLTDSELLSSPTQVLYATISADKHRHNNNNLKNQNTASQTVQTGFRPVSVDRHMKARTSSKENILDDLPHYRYSSSTGVRSGSPAALMNNSRSLDRHIDSDKENRRQELKARIHVTSPTRYTPERQLGTSRKPYKTTINTATDTIQYRGFSSENLNHSGGHSANGHYSDRSQFAHSGRRIGDTEHYKVPRNKAPVPTAELLARRPNNMRRTDSENSSSAYNGSYYASAGHSHDRGLSGGPQQFASTSLVRNVVESRHKRSEYDREGRRIQSERRSSAGPPERSSRAYSGYSTSPERDVSPDRYAIKQSRSMNGSKMNLTRRSPSSSPTRPPRTRSSGGGEVRREHSGRHVERTPSTRAAATSRSPIKKIQRVHNEIQHEKKPSDQLTPPRAALRERSGGGAMESGARGVKSLLLNSSLDRTDRKKSLETNEDRLAKFTEYRGSGKEEVFDVNTIDGRGSLSHAVPHRRGSHSVGGRRDVHPDSDREGFTGDERELRGQSVPPGANIDSMRDFYKTSQYQSMYHLPPSPSRPAPILDRDVRGSNKTLERMGGLLRREKSGDMGPPSRSSRLARTSVSEGELTDDQSRQERVLRQRSRFLNSTLMMGKLSSNGGEGSPAARRRLQTAGQLPVTSNSLDRGGPGDGHRTLGRQAGARGASAGLVEGRRQHSREVKRPAPQPPTQRVRRSSVDVLETSMSESESPRQEKAKSDIGGRWANGQSDVEVDYRRDLVGSVHSEARGRGGGGGGGGSVPPIPSIYQQAAALARREIEISQDDDEEEVVRSPTSLAREEERRKILQLEEDRRRAGAAPLSRSSSRITRIIGLKGKSKSSVDTEAESQYSGHSSATSLRRDAAAGAKGAPPPSTRLNNGAGRVKRSGSSATSPAGRQIPLSRRKMPGSVTSSLNSSESEQGSLPQSAASAQSNRSVYLHATAVADIPPSQNKNPSVETNLKNSKKISRSISLLAPFKSKQPAKEKEITYDSAGNIVPSNGGGGKPPRPPPAPLVRRAPPPPANHPNSMVKERKFASSSDLLRDEPSSFDEGIMVSGGEDGKSSSKVSRSVSMPKDTRLAGWFKKRKRI